MFGRRTIPRWAAHEEESRASLRMSERSPEACCTSAETSDSSALEPQFANEPARSSSVPASISTIAVAKKNRFMRSLFGLPADQEDRPLREPENLSTK